MTRKTRGCDLLIGVDLSQFNSVYPLEGGDFQIHRMTYGCNFVDMSFESWWLNATTEVRCCGVYHVVDDSPPVLQAQFIRDTMVEYKVDNVIICYDWELDTNEDSQGDSLRGVITATRSLIQHQPVIYSDIYNYNRLMQGSNSEWFKAYISWWLADYETPTPYLPTVYDPLLRQYTDRPFWDMNLFYGTVDGWNSLSRYTKILKEGE